MILMSKPKTKSLQIAAIVLMVATYILLAVNRPEFVFLWIMILFGWL